MAKLMIPVVSLLFLVSLVSATQSLVPSEQLDLPQTFIIHTSRSDKPASFSSHRRWYSSILQSLTTHTTHTSRILYTYSRAVNGFSATLTSSQAEELRRLPGVLSVLPDRLHQIHTTHTPDFLGLAEDSGIWPNSNYAEDVIIGVLDTGIWPERPSFSDEDLSPVPSTWKGKCVVTSDFPASACNRKIIGARAYFRGYEAGIRKPMNLSREPNSPRDTEGHGTHTASTAAGAVVSNAGFFEYAKGEARGMATKARIAVYKICWTNGCYESDILRGMDQAIEDGVNVISLSVGASRAQQYDSDSIAIGAFGATQHGIIVSCSAGNSGPGAYTAVNIAPWIITVGASTLDREFPADVVLGDGRLYGGVSLYSGDPLADSQIPLVYAADAGNRYCYSRSLNSTVVAGKIVICDRGGNARVEKGAVVKEAGGVGMIMANTEESGEELLADSHLIPATMVGQAAADKIRAYVHSDKSPTAKLVFRGTVIGKSPSAPRVASFSSRGPNRITPEILKPDVIAPGVNILAGWTGYASPTDLDIDPRRVEFNIISGTSMSCPHVSGLAALLRKAYPEWTPAAIKSALITTAYNLDNNGKNITDLATGEESTPFVHGGGHVDPNTALNPGLVYDITESDYVAFLCAIGYTAKRIAVFVSYPVDCGTQSLDSPGNLNYPSFSVLLEPGKVVKYKREVKNVGGPSDTVYEVEVNAPPSIHVSVSPEKLAFSKEKQTLSYEISFRSGGSALNMLEVASELFGSIVWSNGVHRVRSPIGVQWSKRCSSSSSSSM